VLVDNEFNFLNIFLLSAHLEGIALVTFWLSCHIFHRTGGPQMGMRRHKMKAQSWSGKNGENISYQVPALSETNLVSNLK